MRLHSIACLLLALTLMSGCRARGDATRPLPLEVIAAPAPAKRLVVVLPGRADNLRRLRASGVATAVQHAWPDAEVVLAELTMDYYLASSAERRLHDEVIVPARARGLREVWLVGASLGGMGALLYDRSYPGVAHGLVLLAPYLGDDALLDEIRRAGGVGRWNPGPMREVAPDTWQREMWRNVHRWTREPGRRPQVWLAYGHRDGFSAAMPLLGETLEAGRVLEREGGHSWRVWTPAVGEILRAHTLTAAPSLMLHPRPVSPSVDLASGSL